MLKTHIPTLLGIMFVLVGIVTTVLIVEQKQQTKLLAAYESRPQNVRITNISDNTFTVTWLTQHPTKGSLKWGTKQNSLSNTIVEENEGTTHSITIDNLMPQSSHYFVLVSKSIEFDNNSIPWRVKTGPILPISSRKQTISGTINNVLGQPLNNALVYAIVGGGSPLSTIVSDEGSFVFSISRVRSPNLNAHVQPSEQQLPVEIIVYTNSKDGFSQRYNFDLTQTIPTLFIQQGGQGNYEYTDVSLPKATIVIPNNDNLSGFGKLLIDISQ